jgi:ABC-type multidrug transport system fused ATPase/permease subunit
MIAIAALMFAVGYIVQNDTSRIPILISFILILSRLSHPVLSLNEGVNYISLQSNAVNVLGDFLDRPQGRTVTEGAHQCPPLKARLELRNVSFRYSDERPPVLDAVSLSIAKGSFVALVGGSGGGKTTIVRLMARLIDPSTGGVFADGVDLREYTTASWRAGIGVIPQDIYLFNDTIAANLRLAKPEATDAELVAAAKAAHAHDFITAQPKGYATLVGDRGSAFSGGQQQRLAIARALIADPAIIIMDEATSNLDSESEREIKKVIAELRGRRTIVVVAHRLSTIEGADEILVIEGGKLVERGNHATLRAAAGVYARLVGHDAVA